MSLMFAIAFLFSLNLGEEVTCVADADKEDVCLDPAAAQKIEKESIPANIRAVECPQLYPNCTACANKVEDCTYYKVAGSCETHPGWMLLNCPKTCGFCHKLDFWVRCHEFSERREHSRVLTSGGHLNALFEGIANKRVPPLSNTSVATEVIANFDLPKRKKMRIAETAEIRNSDEITEDGGNHAEDEYEFDYNVTVLSRDPWIVQFDGLLTAAEAKEIIAAAPAFERSTDAGRTDATGHMAKVTSKYRTSANSWCMDGCAQQPVIRRLMGRLSAISGVPAANSEHLQVLQYEKGQYYNAHNDYIGSHTHFPCGPRILTFYVYLSEVANGGETAFPNMGGMAVKPKIGRAVLWPSVLDSDVSKSDRRTVHSAQPVIEGVKHGVNAWFHLFDFQAPNKWTCTG